MASGVDRSDGLTNEIWVEDGWKRELLSRLNAELRALEPGYRVHQVTEKFGEMRFYWEALLTGRCPRRVGHAAAR